MILDSDGYLWWHEVQRTAQCNITRSCSALLIFVNSWRILYFGFLSMLSRKCGILFGVLPDSFTIFSLVSCPLKLVSGVTLQLQGSHGFVTFDR